MTRVLVCGSREFADRKLLYGTLDLECGSGTVIIHGGAPGADALAEEYAHWRGYATEVFHADWKTHGRAAGPMRNQKMIESNPDLVVAFPLANSVGTHDTLRRAKRARIKTLVVEGRQR